MPNKKPGAPVYEYRLIWRRANWTGSNQSRTFARRHSAERLYAKLTRGRADLAPATVALSHRKVGRWVAGWPK